MNINTSGKLEIRAIAHAATANYIANKLAVPDNFKTACLFVLNEKAKKNTIANYKGWVEPVILKYLIQEKKDN